MGAMGFAEPMDFEIFVPEPMEFEDWNEYRTHKFENIKEK